MGVARSDPARWGRSAALAAYADPVPRLTLKAGHNGGVRRGVRSRGLSEKGFSPSAAGADGIDFL